MTRLELPPMPTSVRPLSENEIQDRLYGKYQPRKKASAPQFAPVTKPVVEPVAKPAPVPAPKPIVSAPPAVRMEKIQMTENGPAVEIQWSGSEILGGELERLRSELLLLREEKEKLAVKLQRVKRQAPAARNLVHAGEWMTRAFASLLMIGGIGYIAFAGGTALMASPSMGDPTPYTVQVGVYNNRLMADQARNLLEGLGYDAFLVEVPRIDGSLRYRIYVGSFVTKEEAARESYRLAADSRFLDFKDAFVLAR